MPFFCLLLMTSTFSVGNLSRDIDEKSIREPRVRNKLFGKEGGGEELKEEAPGRGNSQGRILRQDFNYQGDQSWLLKG